METIVPAETTMEISTEDDIVAARQQARLMARALEFGMVDQSRIATAVSELTRNVLRYATNSTGRIVIREKHNGDVVGIEIIVADDGPGIANMDEVLREGYSSGGGMGMGLPGTRRLMDEMNIDSAVGRGTTVTIRKWHR